MSAQFFLILCGCLAVPALISRLMGKQSLLPLVFVQLLCGLAIQVSGLYDWLRGRGWDLLDSQLGASVQGIGWLGVALLVALTASNATMSTTDRRSLQFVWISLLGFGVTLAAGAALGWALLHTQPDLAGSNATPVTFALALGICLAVTALPVLVSILKETGLADTPVGRLAVLSALLDDLWLWLGLMAVLSFAELNKLRFVEIALPLCGYFGLMFGLVRPMLQRRYARVGNRPQGPLVGVCTILLSAAATDALGVHAMLGAFIGGAVLPQAAVRDWGANLSHVVKSVLIPVFFVTAGLRLRVDWGDSHFWTLVALLTVAAVGVKGLMVTLVAKATGLDWSRSLLLGTLMQCKGLMELVAINILHEAKIISTPTYSALAVMALISTFITAPLLRFWAPHRRHEATEQAIHTALRQ